MVISVVAMSLYVMISVMKMLLLAATAVNQVYTVTVPCARALLLLLCTNIVVALELIALMALMNLTHILSVIIAQRRALSPVQVFLGTVESSVMPVPHVQISGTNYFPPANLIQRGTNQMSLMLPSAVRRMASTSAKMDPCV